MESEIVWMSYPAASHASNPPSRLATALEAVMLWNDRCWPTSPVTRGHPADPLKEIAEVAREEHRLFEKDLPVCDTKRVAVSQQHVLAAADPAVLLRVEPGAVDVKVRGDAEPVVAFVEDLHVGDQVPSARRRIFGPGISRLQFPDANR